VKNAELGNENGYVVWEVEVAAQDGTLQEVKVDAGNGKVLAQETGDNEGSEKGEANEANEGPEANEASEAGATTNR
ncbi:MAG: PepSY domain-containing protein, partial [Rubrobacteraceae bacterium]